MCWAGQCRTIYMVKGQWVVLNRTLGVFFCHYGGGGVNCTCTLPKLF